jgi:hypothetical protein
MIRKRLVFEHATGFHNPEIHALLRGLAAFSEKGENLRLIIETGGIVDVHQRPEKTNRQSLSAPAARVGRSTAGGASQVSISSPAFEGAK